MSAANNFQSKIVGDGYESPDQLLANPANWRIHPKAQQDALEGILSEVGWVQQIIVNQRTGHIVDGHLRVQIAMRNNEPSVPVLYVDLDENEEQLILATLDPLAAMAATDQSMLNELIQNVSVEDESVLALLNALQKEEPNFQEDEPSEVHEFGDLGTPVIQYTIIFDNVQQQERFYALARHLKKLYPEDDTLACRLDRWVAGMNLDE